ncbi:MAG TPA: cupredoxin domain-containing protein [Xanthomonadales bacterium]|nr:cupredoxin domain-containing protein [Xanthomonadales bacterium]
MNKNFLIVVIVLLIVVGGFVLVKNNSTTVLPTKNSENQTQETDQEEDNDEDDKDNEGEHEITLTGSGFEPSTITVKVGDEVVWKNESGGESTVDSQDHPTHLRYAPLNLGSFEDGEDHELVFDKKGTYGYHDHLHPDREGTVVVE